MRRRWTEVEEKFLREHHSTMNNSDIAEHLGRSYVAVKNKAHQLGLIKPGPIPRNNKPKPKRTFTWTLGEKEDGVPAHLRGALYQYLCEIILNSPELLEMYRKKLRAEYGVAS